ncbi:unnamed protein product [Rotaria socialis]|uniref:Uncharacterized protein n=1 Tax=Rotaria socialis TaxID=392032 RepID=A0A819YCV7_9BILA|nr:unnamed protein product [Rotaria socialis]CAF3346179.1 unnamed protein product [Rotaria socialis]CAF3378764.1 unnamed protein product [Rotaria socialis]CAF3495517.1 unnamed protein product [Rotaria socialis]CAF3506109.1 unnamed protein product [Rotaria socialis]
MPAPSRRKRNSSSESSNGLSSSSSSSDDEEISSTKLGKSTMNRINELTLKDDEDTISFQAPLPEYYEEPGESDDDRRILSRVLESSASGVINNDKKHIEKKKRKRLYFICVSMCKYECVRRAAKRLNFREVSDEDDWNVYWTDTSVGIERVAQMKKWQKINHFPGMSEICRKDSLTRNMSRMYKTFPKEYGFYPRAWCLPADYSDFSKYCAEKKGKTFISKPDVGCQGRGIFLTKNPGRDIKPTDNFVVQVYVNRPFLIDGYKFDLRVYVAVTSCDPFRVFVYKDGLARFTTQHYEEPSTNNCKDIFMHLTNYAIQKRSDDFIRDEDTGTKRRITTINRWLIEHGYDIAKLWTEIDDVIIKVLISAHPILKHNYRACFPNHYRGSACFEILGFDILIDRKLKPYVLEVNHSPSFTTDSKLDREIKDALIYDTLLLMNMPAADKRRFIEEEKKRVKDRLFQRINKKDKYREEQEDLAQRWQKEIEKWEDDHIGNYRRIYPTPEAIPKYEKYFTQSGTLYSETAASKARIEQAKVQMDELQKKQDKLNAFKSGKSSSNTTTNNSKEFYGESSTKRSLPIIKSSRSSSFNRTPLKRLTNNAHMSTPTTQLCTDPTKPIEIDETEELERMLSLKHRETLIRGMGIVDMCHRMLFGTPGTMANLQLKSNGITQLQGQCQSTTNIDVNDLSQNLSLLQYVGSKLPHGHLNRYHSNNTASAQALQQYFSNQQHQSQPKHEVRPTRTVQIFDEKFGNMVPSQNGSRNGRYQQIIRSPDPQSRFFVQTNVMPQISANILPNTNMITNNSSFDLSIRTKSATGMTRQRTGLLG